jgi:hypothetical protein
MTFGLTLVRTVKVEQTQRWKSLEWSLQKIKTGAGLKHKKKRRVTQVGIDVSNAFLPNGQCEPPPRKSETDMYEWNEFGVYHIFNSFRLGFSKILLIGVPRISSFYRRAPWKIQTA